MVAMNEAIRHYNQGMGRMITTPNVPRNQNASPAGFAGKGNNPYQQYQQNAVKTASPQELTLMLYNGLVRFLKTAREAIDDKNIEKTNNYLIKSQNILTEFMSTLDMQYEVSQGLFSIYEYMNRRLIEANIKKDKEILTEIIGYAEDLRDTWEQAMKLAKIQIEP